MKSATKALKTNKYPLKKDLAPKKNDKINKGNNLQKNNINPQSPIPIYLWLKLLKN